MSFAEIVTAVDDFAWGPVMLILLVGTGLYLSIRSGFLQFTRFGYAMRNTIGKIFTKQQAGKGEVTPFQAMTTALAGTVGTGNIAGVTGAIFIGGPGAVFWLWISALVGMVTKYSEVVLAVRFRERNAAGDWVGGPMYYIKNGLGKGWIWLSFVFAFFGMTASFGIGNTTQVDSIATAIGTAVNAFGGDVSANTVLLFGNAVPVFRLVIGILVALFTAVVIIGGIKRIGAVTEKLVPAMAVIYILAALAVVFGNIGQIGAVLGDIFTGAFTPAAVCGGAAGVVIMTTIQKGIARGVFSNEAGLGSAPIAHAATSETDPVKQGVYGIFEVFMDSIVICTLTSLALLMGLYGQGAEMAWGNGAGSEMVVQAFSGIFGGKIASVIIAVGLSLFAFSTVLSWALYGSRCVEFLFGKVSKPAALIYKILFCIILVIGSTLGLDIVWDIGDALNGLMAIPNLIALLLLSGTIIKITKEHFAKNK
ncbi:MAG: sodium:alanine symporter family protein [Oscillospiraceae bacterium]|nr:sodium:alanine symporter family protein [Oscillospiraceae bacterium]